MKFLKIVLIISIVSFLNTSNVLGNYCKTVMDTKMALDFNIDFGILYFYGYNYAKKTNINYSKSKMKEYVIAVCESQPDASVDEIYGKAAETNYDMSKFSYGNTSYDEEFVIALNKIVPVSRECILKKTPPNIRKIFASKLDKLEIECGKKCIDKKWFKLFSEKDHMEISEVKSLIDSCKK